MTSTSNFKIGDKVSFGRANGEQTLGTVVKVNPSRLKVRQDEERGTLRVRPEGTIWTVPPSLCRLMSAGTAQTPVAPAAPVAPQAKRPDAAILADIVGVYSALSPENLHCDGEISRSAAARKAVTLNARLRALFTEIGRRVSEDEAYRLTARDGAPVGLPLVSLPPLAPFTPFKFDRAPAKKAGFKAGDKVQFKGKHGEIVVGFVRQSNTKTITVDPIGANAGRYWRVSPSLLTAV